MISFFKKIFQLFILSVFVYIILLILWGEFIPDGFKNNLFYPAGKSAFTYSRIKDIPNFKNTDILILGSSHAYRGYDTRIFKAAGFNTFNLGTSSQTPIQTELLLAKYLDILNPKLVLYEISPDCFTNDGVESSLDIIANNGIDLQTFWMACELNNIKTYNSFIYALYRNIFNRNKGIDEDKSKENDRYVSGGFVEKNTLTFKEISLNDLENNLWDPKKYQLQAFEKIINNLHKRNIELIFVQAPITKFQYELFKDKKIFDNFIKTKGGYYNYNDSNLLQSNIYFGDRNHLNQNGVELFNASLIKNILEK